MRVVRYIVTEREYSCGTQTKEYRLEVQNGLSKKVGCVEVADASVPEEFVKRSLYFTVMKYICEDFMEDMEIFKETRTVI